MIKIVGLGAGDISQISYGAMKALESGMDIYLRTEKHPIVEKLNIGYTSFDSIYDSVDVFEEVYETIAKKVVDLGKDEDVVYAVPGHPMVAETSVSMIRDIAAREGVEFEIIPSMSFVDAMYECIGVDPVDGFKLLDAYRLKRENLDYREHIIITQVCNHFLATEVMLTLMNYYKDDIEVSIVTAAGIKDLEEVRRVKLYDLDNSDNKFDDLTSVFIQKNSKYKNIDLADTLNMLAVLDEFKDDATYDDDVYGYCDQPSLDMYAEFAKHIKINADKLLEDVENEDVDAIMESSSDALENILKVATLGDKHGYFDMWDIINMCGEKNKLVKK